MRTRTFILLITACLLMSLVTTSCQQNEISEIQQSAYSEAPYLDVEIPKDESQMTTEDLNTLMEGLIRLQIYKNEDGLYAVVPQTAEEVNMSERLFDYLLEMIERSSERLRSIYKRM